MKLRRVHPVPGALIWAAFAVLTPAASLRAEEVRIVRDSFGIPHIFAPTDEGAAFGLGYAQAEDRLEELLLNYRRAEGTAAEVRGTPEVQSDTFMKLADNRGVSERGYAKVSAKTRAMIEAFMSGVRLYMNEHPAEVPAWAPPLDPWRAIALGRLVILGWPIGDAVEDLGRAGIKPQPLPYRGSNEWLIHGSRTEPGAPMALIDPHLSWYGVTRFYEARLYGETIKVSGVGILGVPMVSLGHSRWCSVAMTTGSGDTADIFEETLDAANPRRYKLGDQWRDMTVRRDTLAIRRNDGQVKTMEIEVESTVHGPVVARKDGKAYAAAIPYDTSIGLADQIYEMMTARNLTEMKTALSKLELMGQNVMVATVDGDIYYQRTGKVPIRGEGVDASRPIPGHLLANQWKGFYSAEQLVQITNPAAGYMQNCNVSPRAMIKEGAPKPEDYPAVVYGYELDPPHQRAAMVLERLAADSKVTIDEALELAMCVEVFGAAAWQKRLEAAWTATKSGETAPPAAAALVKLILEWDRFSRPDSKGASAYRAWKERIPKEMRPDEKFGAPPPESLPDAAAVDAALKAAEDMTKLYGSVEVPYGQIYRAGREEGNKTYPRTYPVGGGNPGGGMATPRAINFDKLGEGTFIGRGGQTAAQVVLLTKPPKSWSVLPLGESDRKDSGHWDDQAEKLFSEGKMKPTHFLDETGLKADAKSERKLKFPPG